MKNLVTILILLCVWSMYSQQTYTLNGTVKDQATTENLTGVNILFPDLGTGTISNEYGFYSIRLPEGTHRLIITYLGYSTLSQEVTITQNTTFSVELEEASENLEEVVITESGNYLNIRKPEMSVTSLDINTIQEMPVLFGEVDVIKSLLLMPGVSNAGEGSSGFNVRGGAADQNLILLDEATLYNASHLYGFVSVFNPDAIKDLKLYKGGIPAEYGGRVSSVLDIHQKNGNTRKFGATGGIGLISSRLLIEGPIVKDRGSFLLGGRSSYAHLFLKLADNDNSAYFYDLNTKLSYQLDDRNTLLLSGYFGRDVFDIGGTFNNLYGNSVLNLRWNHVLTSNVFTNLSLIFSDYYYGLTLDFVGFNWNSGIRNFNVKYDVDHYINDNIELNYGIQGTYYQFNPGELEPSSETSGINYQELTKKFVYDGAAYFSVQHTLSDNLSAQYGLRYSTFFRMGQDELNLYTDDQAVRYNADFGIYQSVEPSGTKTLSKSKVERSFGNLEPRLAVAYSFNDNESVKLSYNRMAQYLHLITNTNSPSPLDVWAPSGKYIDPQLLDQYAIGYFRNFKQDQYSLEVEAFYKSLQNRLDYIDGANLIANDAIEQVLLSGEGRSYGLEVLLRKNTGRLTGWLGYTLSNSEQRTPGRTPGEPGINNSNWYPTPYDKTHDLSVTLSYDLSDKWVLSSNFVVQSGLPATFPTGQYRYEDLNIPVYGERNSDRLPAYHRLDISATYTPKKQRNSNFESSWNFGIYNLYNRMNALSLSFRENRELGRNEAVRLSLFGIIPSVTYNFKF